MTTPKDPWPPGEGEIARLIRARDQACDWAKVWPGPVVRWPERLRSAVETMLDCPHVALLVIGPARLLLYNGAAARLHGDRHPEAFGRPVADSWPRSWPVAGALHDRVFAGEVIQLHAQPLDASGPEGEVFDVTLVPVRAADGTIFAVQMTGVEIGGRLRAEAALRASEERYRTLFDRMGEGFALCDLVRDANGQVIDLRCRELNPALERLTGLARRDLVGRSLSELFSPEDLQRWLPLCAGAADRGQPVAFEQYAEFLDRWYEVAVYPQDGAQLSIFCREVTARKQAESRLRASEARLSATFRIQTVGVTFWDRDFRLAEVNDAFLRMTGLAREEAIGRTWTDLTPPEFHEASRRARQEILGRGETTPYEKQHFRRDGSRWWGLFAARRIGDEIVEFVLDVTGRRETEEALRQSETQLSAIFASASVGLSEISLDGRFLKVNQELCRILGRPEDEVLKLSIAQVIHAADRAASLDAMARSAEGRATPGLDMRYLRPDGSAVWTSSRIVALRHGGDRPDSLLAVTMDIADRRQSEKALRESEQRFRGIVETATDYAIFTTDAEGRIETWPRGAQDIFGWSAAEALERPVEMTFTPEDRAAGVPRAELRHAREQGQAPDRRWHQRKDGSRVFIEGVTRPLRGQDGEITGFLKVGQDVTDRRAIEAALQESEARFRQFGDASADLLWIRNGSSLAFEYLSSAFEKVYGTPPEDILAGSHLRRWAGMILREDRARALAALRRVRAGEALVHSFRIRRADGQIRWIRNTDFPLLDAAGRVQRIGGITHDATEELELQARLNLLVAELQHRSRNLVGVVQAVTERTLATSGTLEDFRIRIRARLAALGRVNGLLSRLDDGERITFDQLLTTELRAHGMLAEDTAQVSLAGPLGVPLRSATVQTFALALHELTTNALKYGALATPEGHLDVNWALLPDVDGEPRLRVEWTESGAPPADPAGPAVGPETPGGAPRRRGYGRELIERALPYQLMAETSYEIGPGGVHCTIVVPVSTTIDLAFSIEGEPDA